jgi:hypothetical protein
VRIPKLIMILALVALAACPGSAGAQDQSAPQTTESSVPAQNVGAAGTGESAAPQEEPDTNPLSGGFLSTVGSPLEVHSYLQPELEIGEEAFSNPGYTANNAGGHFKAITVPMGGLSLDLLGRRNEFGAQYLGGGFIDDSNSSLDSQFHEVSLVDRLEFRRGLITVADSFSYTPETNFGFGGAGVLGGFGTGLFSGLGSSQGLGQINPSIGTNESILTTGYGATGNTAVVEGAYLLSPRTSIVGMGAYGTLQFSGSSALLDGNHADGLVGLDHRLSPKDTIGVSYMYGTFHYTGSPIFFDSQRADFRYGRKITGRLGFQVYGGPEFVNYHPTSGSSVNKTYLSGTANLSYLWYRNTLGLYVGRFSSGGSGVVPGAETTTLSGSWGRELTRTWTGALYGGYSRNSGFSLAETPINSTTLPTTTGRNATYNYWFGSLTLIHPLTRHTRLHIGYEYQGSTSNTGPCTKQPCTGNLTNQVLGVGITFTPGPFQL